MDLEIPSWLNNNFLKTALEDGDNSKDIDIVSFEVNRAVPKGNNYMCNLFRVKVDHRIKNSDELIKKSIIVKSPIHGGLSSYLFNFGIVQKEVMVYKEFLPKLCKLLNDENEYLTPKSYPSIEENVIVMDDLNTDGFKMANRLEQLDFSHTAITLKHLAKYHAASVKLHNEDPEFVERIGEELLFRKDSDEINKYILGSGPFKMMGIELSTWPEAKDYLELMNGYIDVAFDKLIDCFERKDNEFNVLCHGDFWMANFLFKYDDNGKPIKVKFVDLQITRYASPALDLIYLFYGSVQEEVRTTRYEELIRKYVNDLNEELEKFNCKKRVAPEEIFKAIEARKFYMIYANITLLPTVIQDTKDVMEIKEMSENDLNDLANNPFRKYLQTEKYKKLLLKRMKEYTTVFNGEI